MAIFLIWGYYSENSKNFTPKCAKPIYVES